MSAGPLRAKASKTMPGCAAAGVFGMLPEAWDYAQRRQQASSPGFTCFAAQRPTSAKKRSS